MASKTHSASFQSQERAIWTGAAAHVSRTTPSTSQVKVIICFWQHRPARGQMTLLVMKLPWNSSISSPPATYWVERSRKRSSSPRWICWAAIDKVTPMTKRAAVTWTLSPNNTRRRNHKIITFNNRYTTIRIWWVTRIMLLSICQRMSNCDKNYKTISKRKTCQQATCRSDATAPNRRRRLWRTCSSIKRTRWIYERLKTTFITSRQCTVPSRAIKIILWRRSTT